MIRLISFYIFFLPHSQEGSKTNIKAKKSMTIYKSHFSLVNNSYVTAFTFLESSSFTVFASNKDV